MISHINCVFSDKIIKKYQGCNDNKLYNGFEYLNKIMSQKIMGVKRFKIFNLLLFLLLLFSVSDALSQQHEKLKVVFTNVEGKNIPLICEVADTFDKRSRGLMYRDNLDYDKGMIFVYNNSSHLKFWMKNTKIPLSIAFIDAGGYITGIREMQPNSLEIITSSQKVKYAVEANKGWFEKNYIKSGANVSNFRLGFCIGLGSELF